MGRTFFYINEVVAPLETFDGLRAKEHECFLLEVKIIEDNMKSEFDPQYSPPIYIMLGR